MGATNTSLITRVVLNVRKISDALWIGTDDVMHEFTDGRVIARFSEYWAGKIYLFDKCRNSNQAGYDGTMHIDGAIHKVGVRTLTRNGVKFQQSHFIGAGRTCTQENLISSLKMVDYEVVVDIVGFPTIVFLIVPSETLQDASSKGTLTPAGWNRDTIYRTVFHVAPTKIQIDRTIIA